MFRAPRAIGRWIDGMAQVLGTAVQAGQCSPDESDVLRKVARQVRWEICRVAAVMSGNLDYWGMQQEALASTEKLRGKRLKLVRLWPGLS